MQSGALLQTALHSGNDSRAARVKAKKRLRRAKKRALQKAIGFEQKGVALKRVAEAAANDSCTQCSISVKDFTVARGGWRGRRTGTRSDAVLTIGEAVKRGYRLIEWDGRSPHAILDEEGRVLAVLAGRARGNFSDVIEEASKLFARHSESITAARTCGRFKSESGTRGDFYAVNVGVSYGGGQTVPMQSAVAPVYSGAVKDLLESAEMSRLAGFQNQAFEAYFPGIHKYYREVLQKLYDAFPEARRPYEGSIMPAATFNFGPATVCREHVDAANLSFGICAITALGSFDYKRGGHIVLKDLGVVAEFPPGSTVLIPSATVTHANTALLPGETRYSFTQYAAGSLFSYVENGMKSNKRAAAESTPEERKVREERIRSGATWEEGRDLFPFLHGFAKR